MEEKEKRIRAITQLYYSNPKVQEALVEFAKEREVIPRYFEGFGKRPDILQYPADVGNLVKKGATSFHASEELWHDPLQLNSELSAKEMAELRKGWDLLVDIDSQFLDYSKIAALFILEALEFFGIKNYGVKFSGSKGFHIIVPMKAFPQEFKEQKTSEMFPEWPRAICEFLMDYIREDYNAKTSEIVDFEIMTKRTKLSKEELQEMHCKNCGKKALKGEILIFRCNICGLIARRKNVRLIKKRIKCDCGGVLEFEEKEDYFYCENCKDFENQKIPLSSDKYPENFIKESFSAKKIVSPDLVLVSPRHLFRMPYSLHEKTALASVVLNKNEIENFSPKDAEPLKIKIKNFLPESKENEAIKLLAAALDWKKWQESKDKEIEAKKYKTESYKEIDFSKVNEEMFPPAIKKLLLGLNDGRKRGLFILLTFLRSLNFSPEYINKKIREWNEKNKPPLKEGYVKSQISWHLKQKKKILPPNYSNEGFYKDLGLLEKKPETKNPIVDVMRNLRKK